VRPVVIAAMVCGGSVLATGLVMAMTFGLIAALGMVAGGITAGAVVVAGMFGAIWWAESR